MKGFLYFAIGVFGLTAVGCVGGKAIERSYYSIQYPMEGIRSTQSVPSSPARIQVDRCTAAIAYDRQEIVYRSDPHEFRYYWYRLWAAKPARLIQEQVRGHLKQTGQFTAVVGRVADIPADYRLRCHLYAIEELDSAEGRWFANLDIGFTLTRISDRETVFEKRYAGKQEVFEKRPVFVVRALSALLKSHSAELSTDLVKVTQDIQQSSPLDTPTERDWVVDITNHSNKD